MSTNYSFQIDPIYVEKLKFDPKNPRLPGSVSPTNESEVLDFMIQKAHLAELMGSISEQGFFIGEPLLVVEDPKELGTYIVVEGNRRLAAVKLILYPEKAPSRRKAIEEISNTTSDEIKSALHELPVLRFKHRDEILEYLGYRHITGIQSWGSLAKARYLKQLGQKKQREASEAMLVPDGMGLSSQKLDAILAKEIGSRADYVGQMLAGLEIYERIEADKFFHIGDLDEDSVEFAVLFTSLSYTNLYEFLGMESRRDRELNNLDEDHLRELTTWMFKKNESGSTVLGESRNLKKLNDVVADPEALRLLRNGASLESAYTQSMGPQQNFIISLQQSYQSLSDAWSQFQHVQKVGQEEQKLISDILNLSRKIRSGIEEEIREKDND